MRNVFKLVALVGTAFTYIVLVSTEVPMALVAGSFTTLGVFIALTQMEDRG